MTTTRRTAGAPRHGFTIAEILVVFVIIVILASVGIPAVRSVLRSTDRAGAANQLSIAIGAARDAALRSEPGRDAAAVFFFDPDGTYRIVPCIQVGTMQDADLPPPNLPTSYAPDPGGVFRDVFVPVPLFEPVTLSGTWSVRGYVPAGITDRVYYESTFGLTTFVLDPHWLFPETGFFFDRTTPSTDNGARGRHRQTFMIRFAGGTGEPIPVGKNEALVVDPSPVSGFRGSGIYRDYNLAQAADLAGAVRRILNDPSLTRAQRQQLLGDEASDTVLARPVAQIVLYDRREMAAFLGVTLNRQTNALYLPVQGATGTAAGPRLSINVQQVRNANAWLEGRAEAGSAYETGARLFTLDRTRGSLAEVMP